MRIIEEKYLPEYRKLIPGIKKLIENYNFDNHPESITYRTQASAVFSSNIEGNRIDLNSYMNFKFMKEPITKEKELQEIEDLVSAYSYAQENRLNKQTFLECHRIFSGSFLIESGRGKYRIDKIGVFDSSGLVYLAIEAEYVEQVMNELFSDLAALLSRNLDTEQAFYFASLAHLKFAHIHPFRDGNGRAARLLEKWFLAEKLGSAMWGIQSEKYYNDHRSEYYRNINLGINYYELNYNDCLPFLLMLPQCLK